MMCLSKHDQEHFAVNTGVILLPNNVSNACLFCFACTTLQTKKMKRKKKRYFYLNIKATFKFLEKIWFQIYYEQIFKVFYVLKVFLYESLIFKFLTIRIIDF